MENNKDNKQNQEIELPKGVVEAVSIQNGKHEKDVEEKMTTAIRKINKLIDEKVFLLQHQNDGVTIDTEQTTQIKDRARIDFINAMLNQRGMDDIDEILSTVALDSLKIVFPEESEERSNEKTKEEKIYEFLDAENQRFYDKKKDNEKTSELNRPWEEKKVAIDFEKSLKNNGEDNIKQRVENTEIVIKDLINNFEDVLGIKLDDIEDKDTETLLRGVISSMSDISLNKDGTVAKGQEKQFLALFEKMYLLSAQEDDISRNALTRIADGFNLDIKGQDGQIDLDKFYRFFEEEEKNFYESDDVIQDRNLENAKKEAKWLLEYGQKAPNDEEKFKKFRDIFSEKDVEKFKGNMFIAAKNDIKYVTEFVQQIEKMEIVGQYPQNYFALSEIIPEVKQQLFEEAFESSFEGNFEKNMTDLVEVDIMFVKARLSKMLEKDSVKSQESMTKIMKTNEIIKSVSEEQEKLVPKTENHDITPEEQMARDKKFLILWNLLPEDKKDFKKDMLDAVKGDIKFATEFYEKMRLTNLVDFQQENIDDLPSIIEQAKKEVFTELLDPKTVTDDRFIRRVEMLATADIDFVNTNIKRMLEKQGQEPIDIGRIMEISKISSNVSKKQNAKKEPANEAKQSEQVLNPNSGFKAIIENTRLVETPDDDEISL